MVDAIIEGAGQPGEPRPEPVLGANRNRVGGGRILPRRHELVNVTCLCLWPRDPISIQTIWERLKIVLPNDLFGKVRKILRVVQRHDQRLRFDLYVTRGTEIVILDRLMTFRHYHSWWVKLHEHYFDRRALRGIQGPVVRMDPDRPMANYRYVKLATWNISSISGKRDEVGYYLDKSQVSILALQETLRTADKYSLCLGGYQIFESLADKFSLEGKRGLALCIRSSLPAYELGHQSPYYVAVECLIGFDSAYIVNIYIPSAGKPTRRVALKDIKRCLTRIFASNPVAKVIVLGDWNTRLEKISPLLAKWRLPLQLLPCRGNPATFKRGNIWSAIDHFVVSSAIYNFVKPSKVNRNWDQSDHWPLECTLRTEHFALPQQVNQNAERPRLDLSKLSEKQDSIISHNLWETLADSEDTDSLSDLAQRFENVAWTVAEETGCRREIRLDIINRPSYRLSKPAKTALARRLRAYKKWVSAITRHDPPGICDHYKAAYLHLNTAARRIKRECSRVSWAKYIARGAQEVSHANMKSFWVWIKQITHRGKSSSLQTPPLRALDGSGLVFAPQAKLNQWFQYYNRLLSDHTGHSQSPNYWLRKLPGPAAPPIEALNQDLTWGEINRVLRKLKNGKSPGRDGLPSEFLKLAYEPNLDASYDGPPTSPFGVAIFHLLTLMWDRGEIPDAWNEAHFVSIFKKGDPTVMENYRGISLLVCIVKLLTIIILTRLQSTLESSGWYCAEQAGFRTFEECLGHCCALFEILKRRLIKGKKTFVVFIDFKKAYDMVPIAAVLRKLELLGVSGKALRFFAGLYRNATLRVRTSYGLSDLMTILRGLHQGCPASPALFDIFINDFLQECRKYGVRVYGIRHDAREIGLLFADDVCLLSRNLPDIQRILRFVQKWAKLHEMEFGVPKCGIMGIGQQAHNLLTRLRDADPTCLQLDGVPVPIVDSYTYLGLKFTNNLDLDTMVAERVTKGRKVLNSLRPFLSSLEIPLAIRITAVKALLVPVLTYGGELWGMNEERTVAPQRVLSESLRLLLRMSARSSVTSSSALCLEFDVPPITASVASARARAFVKYPRLRTTIAGLFRNLPTGLRTRTWITGSGMWIRRYCPQALGEDVSPTETHNRVREIIWDRYTARNKSSNTRTYVENGFDKTKSYLKIGFKYPSLSKGFNWLCRLRIGGFWTVKRFVLIGWLPPQYATLCPFCETQGTGETTEHMLISCARWNEARARFILPGMGNQAFVWENLLGGSRLDSGLPAQALQDRWAPRDVQFQEHVDLQGNVHEGGHGPAHPEENVDQQQVMPLCAEVACFLQTIMPVRIRVLRQIGLRDPRADAAFNGMADEVPGNDRADQDLIPDDPNPPD
jgi:exonuclease III